MDKKQQPPTSAPTGKGNDAPGLAGAWASYALDAWQRAVLYADVRRQRGNQYREHLQEREPTVLNFPSEPVMSGKGLPRPVNYGLVRVRHAAS